MTRKNIFANLIEKDVNEINLDAMIYFILTINTEKVTNFSDKELVYIIKKDLEHVKNTLTEAYNKPVLMKDIVHQLKDSLNFTDKKLINNANNVLHHIQTISRINYVLVKFGEGDYISNFYYDRLGRERLSKTMKLSTIQKKARKHKLNELFN